MSEQNNLDTVHERLFNAYAYLCASIGAQLDLLAKDNNPEVQLQRARVVRKLAQAVGYLGHPVTVAIDQMYETHPVTEVHTE